MMTTMMFQIKNKNKNIIIFSNRYGFVFATKNLKKIIC